MIAFLLLALLGQDPEYMKEIDAWHAQRMASLRSATGYLTLAGLHSLGPGAHTLGSAADCAIVLDAAAPLKLGIITITIAGDEIMFTSNAAVRVERFGSTPPERITTTIMTPDTAEAPTVLSAGPILFHVIQRNNTLFLRVRNRRSPVLAAFKGVERYEVDPRWRVTAELVKEGDGTILVPNILGKTTATPSPGALVFALDGQAHRLHPTTQRDGSLFIVFRDATSGKTTYPGGRFLEAAAPDAHGHVVLDFNRAHNPACAFTAFATCPMPPVGNSLVIKVEAGEKYTQH